MGNEHCCLSCHVGYTINDVYLQNSPWQKHVQLCGVKSELFFGERNVCFYLLFLWLWINFAYYLLFGIDFIVLSYVYLLLSTKAYVSFPAFTSLWLKEILFPCSHSRDFHDIPELSCSFDRWEWIDLLCKFISARGGLPYETDRDACRLA